jgi:hypothetical protein
MLKRCEEGCGESHGSHVCVVEKRREETERRELFLK